LWRSVKGFWCGEGSNFGLFHWLALSPLKHSRTNVRVCDNDQEITILSLKILPQTCLGTTLWNVSVLKATVESNTTSVTTHFKSAWSSSKAVTLNTLICSLKQQDATVTLDNNWDNKHVVPVVNFLKYVVISVVLFSIVAFKHWHSICDFTK